MGTSMVRNESLPIHHCDTDRFMHMYFPSNGTSQEQRRSNAAGERPGDYRCAARIIGAEFVFTRSVIRHEHSMNLSCCFEPLTSPCWRTSGPSPDRGTGRAAGHRSAGLVLLRRLGRLDVFPPGDVGATRGLGKLMQLESGPSLDRAVQRFGDSRGYLYFCLLGGALLAKGLIRAAPPLRSALRAIARK